VSEAKQSVPYFIIEKARLLRRYAPRNDPPEAGEVFILRKVSEMILSRGLK
jgi:hypothetical protein